MGVDEIISDIGLPANTDEIRFTQDVVIPGLLLGAATLTLTNSVSGIERVVIETGLGAVTYTAAGVVTGSAGIAALNIDASAVTTGPLIIVGNAGNNILTGTSSNGNDTLVGGLGNDTYVVNHRADVILEGVGNALIPDIDTVNVNFAASGAYTLDANLENSV
jgi:Ca2+-binding RTX toxin-like protein